MLNEDSKEEPTLRDVCKTRTWPDGRKMCSSDKEWACRTQAKNYASNLFHEYAGKQGEQSSLSITIGSCGQQFKFYKEDSVSSGVVDSLIIEKQDSVTPEGKCALCNGDMRELIHFGRRILTCYKCGVKKTSLVTLEVMA